jgi:hypothetical protein
MQIGWSFTYGISTKSFGSDYEKVPRIETAWRIVAKVSHNKHIVWGDLCNILKSSFMAVCKPGSVLRQ